MSLVESLDGGYFNPSVFKDEEYNTEETVVSPSHYQVFPEFNIEVRDINKRILDNIEASDFDMNLFEAGWYQQAMQYFFRFYAKNGINDLEKGINSLQIMIDNYKERHKD